MKIGDQVRFLNEVGGGKVTGFQGKNIVLVEDEDGFDIPMLRSQVVVVETNANNFEIKKKKEEKPGGVRILEDNVEDDPSERPMTYQPKPQERKGGDLLNVCLAFVPEDSRELTNTRFEAYLVNDSNYYISAVFANNEGTAWHARWHAIIEPNTKMLMDTFDRSMLNDLERLSIQLIAWKQDKPYLMKPAVGVELRLDVVKFYKLHVFQPSPFFREPALVYDIVRDDRPIKQVFVEAEEVLDAMRGEERKPVVPKEVQETALPAAIEEDGGDVAETAEPAAEAPYIPRTREEERAALKAAKRALKEEERAQREKERQQKAERNPHFSKPNHIPAKDEILEVDLHINALLDHTEGLSAGVLLNTQLTEFRIMMDRNIKKKGKRIVFIHGKGEGVLRDAIIKELQRRYRSCTYEDASFQKYGFGATMVTIR